MCTVTLLQEILVVDPAFTKPFRRYVEPLVKSLKNFIMGGYQPEYEIGGVKDPFMQVKILQLFRFLGRKNTKATDEMSDILA